jgi:mRNA interferase MazF
MVRTRQDWVPDRKDIIWIDFNPQRGQEMRDRHPLLVLSPSSFNSKTSLVIGLPMTTAEYNVDNPFAVPIGSVRLRQGDKRGYVLCHQPKSLDWRCRDAKPHPMGHLEKKLFTNVTFVLNQIVKLA